MSGGLSILVVDDDRDNAASLAELFELEGHRVTTAFSGEAAIAASVNSAFDLAFMDVMMPGLNGVESFLEIRKLRPSARVFMMTGYSVEELLQQAIRNGVLGVMAKPLDIGRLLHAVDEVKPDGIVLVEGGGRDTGEAIKAMAETGGLSCSLVRRPDEVPDAGSRISVIDLGQPLIDGVEAYTRLKRQGPPRPAIIVTPPGAESGDALAAFRDVAVTGILNKPFDPSLLLGRLEALAR